MVDGYSLIHPLSDRWLYEFLSVSLFVHQQQRFLRIGSLLFTDFLHEIRVQQTHENNGNVVTRVIFYFFFNSEIFLNSANKMFLKFYMMTSI